MQALVIVFLIILILVFLVLSAYMDNPLFAVVSAVLAIITAYFIFSGGITEKIGENATLQPDNVTTTTYELREQVAPSYNNYFAVMLVLLAIWLIVVASASGKGANEQ